jgi:ubiquinone/menaquinone biosynthesis C-methylase UbiE
MSGPQIRFNDGASYDMGMGRWSLVAGNVFLDWLAPATGLNWIDVGCGTGAFSELISQRCAPADIQGVDPSDAQLAFARSRPATRNATFQVGDAMALPFPADRFDAAVMALVIFFVPDPAKGVAEMARVVRAGGIVAAYAWDNLGGGFPFAPIVSEMRAMGFNPPQAPSVEASRLEAMRDLWTRAGLQAVETREITVSRSFDNFEDFWSQSTLTGSTRPMLAAMQPADIAQVKARVQARMTADAHGRITHTARANAVQGRVPA